MIYVFKSNSNPIISNKINVTGDFLTFGILVYRSNENTIEKNILYINGTGELYINFGSTCIDGGIYIDGGGAGIIPEIYRTYGIIVLYSDDNKIINNTINTTSQLNHPINPNEGTNSIVGIDIYYDSNRNQILDNKITIIANDLYLYGMGVLGSPSMTNISSAYNNVFQNNYMYVKGSYFVTWFIAGQNSFKTVINGNDISYIAGNYSYAITLESSKESQISNNKIYCTGLVTYLIELYESNNNIINDNHLESSIK